jgi:hypothetical protein
MDEHLHDCREEREFHWKPFKLLPCFQQISVVASQASRGHRRRRPSQVSAPASMYSTWLAHDACKCASSYQPRDRQAPVDSLTMTRPEPRPAPHLNRVRAVSRPETAPWLGPRQGRPRRILQEHMYSASDFTPMSSPSPPCASPRRLDAAYSPPSGVPRPSSSSPTGIFGKRTSSRSRGGASVGGWVSGHAPQPRSAAAPLEGKGREGEGKVRVSR